MWRWALAQARGFVDLEKMSLDRAMRQAAPWAHGELLDVGCGDKPYQALFAPYVRRYVGVEYDETHSGTENARRGAADAMYSGERLPFANASFDTVLSTQVAEHVPHPEVFFADLARVLRPEGRLIVTVPFSYRVHATPHDYHRFTRFALARYANEHGMRVDLLCERGGPWTVIGQKLASRLALRAGRMGAEIQRAGAFGYEATWRERPRWWALPLVAPAIVGIAAAARALDAIDSDRSDTMGYLLIATKDR